MDRKATARETLEIMRRGTYETHGRIIDIRKQHRASVDNSLLFTPEQAETLAATYVKGEPSGMLPVMKTMNCSTVEAILRLSGDGVADPGVLNFASAKNPGGGFLNGAMAQEESIAASSGLYQTLTRHPEYYQNNRNCPSMIYTNHAIYSPEVVFFRDGRFELLEEPVTASVLTLPAVNMGQVMQKGEDIHKAETAMYERMKVALSLFVQMNHRHLILGAYGCGVFRNDPYRIASWWKELLTGYFADTFDTVVFAVMVRSMKEDCLRAFEEVFGADEAGTIARGIN